MSVSLSSVTAGTFTRLLFALTCVGVITAARSLAECQLGVQGSPGSVVVSLNCSTAANSAPFIVGVNSTLVTATNINGVLVQEAPGVCKPANGAAGTPISALLYFCGDYSITFLRPVVQGVSVDSNNTAVIAFGGNIDATISSGISSGNSGRMLLLTGQAAVHLQDSTFSNNSAAAAAVALTADNATLTISNSTIIGNQALAPAPADPSAEFWRCTGGALLATGSSSISIQGSLLSNNSAAFGAALATLNFSSATIADSVFQYNSAGVAGGVACGEGNSTQVTARHSWLSACSAAHMPLLSFAGVSCLFGFQLSAAHVACAISAACPGISCTGIVACVMHWPGVQQLQGSMPLSTPPDVYRI